MASFRQMRFPQYVVLRFQINDLGILHGRPIIQAILCWLILNEFALIIVIPSRLKEAAN
jgi:hypothetical protein